MDAFGTSPLCVLSTRTKTWGVLDGDVDGRRFVAHPSQQAPGTRREWQHLGILGPLIRAEVGDTIRVV